jgi:hypothetical protein
MGTMGTWGHGDYGGMGAWGHAVTPRPLPWGAGHSVGHVDTRGMWTHTHVDTRDVTPLALGQDTPWGMWTHGHVDTRGMWTHVHVDRNLGKAWSSRDAPHICYLPPLLHAGSRRPAPMF